MKFCFTFLIVPIITFSITSDLAAKYHKKPKKQVTPLLVQNCSISAPQRLNLTWNPQSQTLTGTANFICSAGNGLGCGGIIITSIAVLTDSGFLFIQSDCSYWSLGCNTGEPYQYSYSPSWDHLLPGYYYDVSVTIYDGGTCPLNSGRSISHGTCEFSYGIT